MKRDWRRTETRVVRPFAGVDGCLANVRFRLFPDAEWHNETNFVVEEDRLADIRPQFQMGIDQGAKSPHDIGPERLSIVISLQDMRLHRSEVVLENLLAEVPESWEIPRETRTRFAWKSGVRATVALALNADRQRVIGQPFLRGHWLERKVFFVRPRPEPRSFPIERWTAEEFTRRDLPGDSAYWVDFITEDFNRRFEDPAEALRVALRDDVYDALAENERSPSGRAVRALIFSEITADILWIGLRNVGSDEEIERGGVLYGILDRIRKTTGATKDELTRYVKEEAGRVSLRVHVQAAFRARRDLAKLARAS